MEGKPLSGGMQTIDADRQARDIPVLFEVRSHADIQGDGPWIFMANRSKRLKVAVGRMRPKFSPLGNPLLGPIVWAQFKNYRFVTKNKAVAAELRFAPNYDVSFSLVSDSSAAEETPLKAGNERKERDVPASAIQAPIRAVDDLDGGDAPKDRKAPDKDLMVKRAGQDSAGRDTNRKG